MMTWILTTSAWRPLALGLAAGAALAAAAAAQTQTQPGVGECCECYGGGGGVKSETERGLALSGRPSTPTPRSGASGFSQPSTTTTPQPTAPGSAAGDFSAQIGGQLYCDGDWICTPCGDGGDLPPSSLDPATTPAIPSFPPRGG